jgi:serralysin
VMSYFGSTFVGANLPAFASLPQLHDIAAIQRLYGANLATRTGDTIYGYNSNTGVPEYSLTLANQSAVFSIWDGGGLDTLDLSGYTTASTIDLREEAFSSVGGSVFNLSIARGAIIENAIGGSGADTIIGNTANNTLNGGSGADNVTGGAGNDTYIVDNASDALNENSGEGTDTVQSSLNWTLAANFENLTLTGAAVTGTGNAENNVITGNALANTLTGGDGNDTLAGNDGADTLVGGLGLDTIQGGAGDDIISYAIGDGNGVIDGGADNDTLNLTDGASDNLLNANYNGSSLIALSGNGLSNLETVNANMGAGTDWLIYAAASAAVIVNLSTGSASGFASIAGVERVIGGNGDDTLTGDGLDNRLEGGIGIDTLSGAGGIDAIFGGDGADIIAGGLGNDSLQGNAGDDTFNWSFTDGRDTFNGGADSDTLNMTGAGVNEIAYANWNGSSLTGLWDNALADAIENININMAGGNDWLIYNTTFAVTVNLELGTGSGFASISNAERVIGGSGDDTLTGDALDNRLEGGIGADTLSGAGGIDSIFGGDGADIINGGAANDSLDGGAGNDVFNWAMTDGRDTFRGGADTDTLNMTGSGVNDVARANWNGTVITGLLDNSITDIEAIHLDLAAGGSVGDWLQYNTSFGISVDLAAGTATGFASIASVENIIGGTGNDALTGDANSNKIQGGDGDDTIMGGGAGDNLSGGLGSDTFVYAAGAGNDTINDFDAWAVGGQDFLDVSAFGIDAGNFAARVAIIDTGADTVVRIDGTYFITLKNVSGDGDNLITSDDFLFA